MWLNISAEDEHFCALKMLNAVRDLFDMESDFSQAEKVFRKNNIP